MSLEFKKKYFKTNTLIKNIIGKELINDDNVAVMELVKNSYDAGASKVVIEFKNLFKNSINTEIVIQDNGFGMDENDILNKWLNIAYSSKKSDHTQNDRYQAGNKGVGRFSCDRLGENLNIYTRQSNQKIIHLKINWKDFELLNEIDTQIQDIPVYTRNIEDQTFKEETGFDIFEHGTILQIQKLRNDWIKIEAKNNLFNDFNIDSVRLLKLKSSLERLINPNQSYSEHSFNIHIKVAELQEEKDKPYYQKVTGKIKNQIFDKLDFKTTLIESFISKNGKEIVTELKDKGKTIFRLIEKNQDFPYLKDIKITIYYLNPYAKGFFKKQTGIQPVEFGSIFLFINGFRIPPYGDRENDALGLEVRKNQGRARYFGNREIIGRIEIKDFENNFRVISSREGIVHNDHYKQLIRDIDKKNSKYGGYFYTTLKRIEKYVVDGLNWDSLPEGINESTIQKEIVDGIWDNFSEVYKIDNDKKLTNSSGIIRQMLAIKKPNVLDLFINEDLIENLIEKDKEKTQEKLENFIDFFGSIDSKNIDENTKKSLKKLTSKIEDENLLFLYKNSLIQTQNIKDELEEEKKSKDELYKLFKKKVNKQRQKAKKEQEKLKVELEITKKQKKQGEGQVAKLKTILSKDTKELVAFQHHIGLYADVAKDYTKDTIRQVKNNEFDVVEYLNNLQTIILELEKIKIISKYITRENYLNAEKIVNDDLVQFIFNYIKSIYKPTTNKDLEIAINTNNIKYVCDFEPIKINIIVDNLLSNSKKEEINAKNIIINFFSEKNTLIMEYIDDGNGISSSIVDVNSIFDIGVTTTSGSGLGMYHIKKLLKDMESSISVEKQTKGVKFLIKFKI
jgi:anti-sigma regulatory factor (Ser/Thr protein kinase)